MLNTFEGLKHVQLIQPRTTNAGFTTAYISLKNLVKAWVICEMTNAAAHATLLTPMRSPLVSGVGAVVLANAVPIWANLDTTTDLLVKRTAAINYTVDAGVTNKVVIFEIDPASLGAGYDCFGMVVANSGEVTNFISITVLGEARYAQDVKPTALTD